MQQRGQLRDIGCFRCALSRASNFAAERRFAEKEAASRRATDAQVLEDAERLNAPGQANANAFLANDRRRDKGWLLVPVDKVPGLPNDQRDRLAHARSSSRRRGD
jgi:hypothetical protein